MQRRAVQIRSGPSGAKQIKGDGDGDHGGDDDDK